MKRNRFEYNPIKIPDRNTCIQAVLDCKNIIEVCKKLVGVI
ncbi:MAG: hypothetical protein ACE5KE_11805 [Methanosarcinales archaeon]